MKIFVFCVFSVIPQFTRKSLCFSLTCDVRSFIYWTIAGIIYLLSLEINEKLKFCPLRLLAWKGFEFCCITTARMSEYNRNFDRNLFVLKLSFGFCFEIYINVMNKYLKVYV